MFDTTCLLCISDVEILIELRDEDYQKLGLNQFRFQTTTCFTKQSLQLIHLQILNVNGSPLFNN